LRTATAAETADLFRRTHTWNRLITEAREHYCEDHRAVQLRLTGPASFDATSEHAVALRMLRDAQGPSALT
jgi:hypothetical protein